MRNALPLFTLFLVAISGVWLFAKCADGGCEAVGGRDFDAEAVRQVTAGMTATSTPRADWATNDGALRARLPRYGVTSTDAKNVLG